jgi:hypothetical protein
MPPEEFVQGAHAGREGAFAPRFPVVADDFVIGTCAVGEHADLIKGEMPLFDQVQGFEEAKSRAIAEDVGLQGPAVGRPPASHP